MGREVGEGGLVNVLLTDLSWNCVRLPLAPRVNEEESEEEEEKRKRKSADANLVISACRSIERTIENNYTTNYQNNYYNNSRLPETSRKSS